MITDVAIPGAQAMRSGITMAEVRTIEEWPVSLDPTISGLIAGRIRTDEDNPAIPVEEQACAD